MHRQSGDGVPLQFTIDTSCLAHQFATAAYLQFEPFATIAHQKVATFAICFFGFHRVFVISSCKNGGIGWKDGMAAALLVGGALSRRLIGESSMELSSGRMPAFKPQLGNGATALRSSRTSWDKCFHSFEFKFTLCCCAMLGWLDQLGSISGLCQCSVWLAECCFSCSCCLMGNFSLFNCHCLVGCSLLSCGQLLLV